MLHDGATIFLAKRSPASCAPGPHGLPLWFVYSGARYRLVRANSAERAAESLVAAADPVPPPSGLSVKCREPIERLRSLIVAE